MFRYYKFKSYSKNIYIAYKYDPNSNYSLRIEVDINGVKFNEVNFNPSLCRPFYEEITEEEFNCYLEL
jgi:hypothetical protein